MVLFNRIVTVTKDTNVHEAYPDWYDGGKTTLTVEGGKTAIHNLLKAKYASRPIFGDSKLHSAKLLIYPTTLQVSNKQQRELSKYKVYKLKEQLENEGSLDAHTTDVLAFASHPSSSVIYKEEKFTGQDIDGDGVPDKGETLTIKGGRAIQYFGPYITVDEAADLKDGIFDSWWGGKALIDDIFGRDNGDSEDRIVLLEDSIINGRLRAKPKDGVLNTILAAPSKYYGHLSFDEGTLNKLGVIKYLRSRTVAGNNSIDTIANVATSSTTLFNKIRHSESKYIGVRE